MPETNLPPTAVVQKPSTAAYRTAFLQTLGLKGRASRFPIAGALALVVLVACTGALRSLWYVLSVIREAGIQQRDFTELYFLADAIRHRLDPTLPLPTIGAELGMPGLTFLPHPTPIPPTAGILLLPLTWLPYSTAALLWFAGCLGLLSFALRLLARVVEVSVPGWLIPVLTVALASWQPVFEDLSWGQVNIIMLTLLTGMVLCFRRGSDRLAGVLLALALLLKPIAWPVVLILMTRRRWQAMVGLAITGAATGMATIVLVGPVSVVRYLTYVLPVATQYYARDVANLSLSTFPIRLLLGAEFPPGPDPQLHFAPLVNSPALAVALRIVVICVVVAVSVLATRHLTFESALGCSICLSIVASPTAWPHYLTLELLPIAILIAFLRRQFWPRTATLNTFGLMLLLAVPYGPWEHLVLRIQSVSFGTATFWPVLPSVLLLAPTYLLLMLAGSAIIVGYQHRTIAAMDSNEASDRSVLLVAERTPRSVGFPGH